MAMPATKSNSQIKMPTKTTQAITIRVLLMVCLRVGHWTFFQLGPHILEPFPHTGEKAGLGLLFGLFVLLGLVGLSFGGLGRLLYFFVFSHCYPSFLSAL